MKHDYDQFQERLMLKYSAIMGACFGIGTLACEVIAEGQHPVSGPLVMTLFGCVFSHAVLCVWQQYGDFDLRTMRLMNEREREEREKWLADRRWAEAHLWTRENVKKDVIIVLNAKKPSSAQEFCHGDLRVTVMKAPDPIWGRVIYLELRHPTMSQEELFLIGTAVAQSWPPEKGIRFRPPAPFPQKSPANG